MIGGKKLKSAAAPCLRATVGRPDRYHQEPFVFEQPRGPRARPSGRAQHQRHDRATAGTLKPAMAGKSYAACASRFWRTRRGNQPAIKSTPAIARSDDGRRQTPSRRISDRARVTRRSTTRAASRRHNHHSWPTAFDKRSHL